MATLNWNFREAEPPESVLSHILADPLDIIQKAVLANPGVGARTPARFWRPGCTPIKRRKGPVVDHPVVQTVVAVRMLSLLWKW